MLAHTAWEGGIRGYRQWQEEASLPKLLFCILSLRCQFITNDHFPSVTKSHFIEDFLPSSAAEPLVSLPGPGALRAVHESAFRGGEL